MENRSIYQDIAMRTGGDIYLGLVGPVRTGKSTFIKKFMETLVIPNIDSDYRRERAVDELPQSSAGKTIMTTEPKFIPEEAVEVFLDDQASFRVRLIDCVGYVVPSALGYVENDGPRMVVTPWFEEEVPFNMAAEIGTRKVIQEHSTIGLVVTTDGSISDIPREEYEQAEERVISELKEIEKPFVVLLNATQPGSAKVQDLARQLSEKYAVPVMPVNCLELTQNDIRDIMSAVLYQFPVKEICVDFPRWILSLEKDHWLRQELVSSILDHAQEIVRIRDVESAMSKTTEQEHVESASVTEIDLGRGRVKLLMQVPGNLLYEIISERTGLDIDSEAGLMPCMIELAQMKRDYEKIKGALDQVEAVGYGIVMPTLEELRLEEPEIVKQGNRYGVRLKASAPSIHMMKADITTEISPIVGSEKQSEELVMYLLQEFEDSPEKIWESNIFGKSLHSLVNEGLHNKLYRMPQEARLKLQETIERIINEGCTGLICIII
ncbi:MAG: stage IV sporulation protein A [Oscillospiraceae bacterium]|nr:stage IV sporulation protein A [Oscillospiraceae bacterium]MDD7042413.1 stage IV sporulation protein A [Oscillospiraceae bacterium]MDY2610252.1 stage IV sporulation protein A [Oscillospiraceae bacterium]